MNKPNITPVTNLKVLLLLRNSNNCVVPSYINGVANIHAIIKLNENFGIKPKYLNRIHNPNPM